MLARLDLRFKGLASAIDAAFSVALSFKDLKLLVRDRPSFSCEEEGSCSEALLGSRGADVGGGPLEVVAKDSSDENDFVDGESSDVVEGTGDTVPLVLGRLVAEIRGLGTADGCAEGYGLA